MHETEIVCGEGVRGTLARPAAGDGRAVLMLHGFASHRDEVGGMYARMAARLATLGIASLRIDFRGWGASAGEMAATTVGGQVEDALAAHGALAALDVVNPARLGVLGFSLGASIAVLAAGANPGAFRSLALWSSTHDLRAAFLAEMGAAVFEAAARQGEVSVDLGFRQVVLRRAFFDSLSAHDYAAAFAGYQGALLVAAGSRDHSAESLPWYRQHARSALQCFYRVDGADHIFNVLSADAATSESVIATTAAWLAMTV
jgi:pimeloyl-ACP methyl ester carboxylesterase